MLTDLLRRIFINIQMYSASFMWSVVHLVYECGFLTLPLNNRELANQMFFHK